VLLVACAVGVATGAGVVLFNDVIHIIRHIAFQVRAPRRDPAWRKRSAPLTASRQLRSPDRLAPALCSPDRLTLTLRRDCQGTPLEATTWGRWARALPLQTAVPVLVLPPTAGGVLVGLLRAATLFDEPPSEAPPAGRGARARALAAPALRAAGAAVSLGTGASLGPEGPSVDIGRAAARGLAGVLRSRRRRLLPLLAAGSGAGVRPIQRRRCCQIPPRRSRAPLPTAFNPRPARAQAWRPASTRRSRACSSRWRACCSARARARRAAATPTPAASPWRPSCWPACWPRWCRRPASATRPPSGRGARPARPAAMGLGPVLCRLPVRGRLRAWQGRVSKLSSYPNRGRAHRGRPARV